MKLDNEANIQAEFYHHAKLIGLNVVLELHTPPGRLDIAILNAESTRLLAIVECKRTRGLFFKGMAGKTRQIERYKTIGVPVYGLTAGEPADRLAKKIQQGHGASDGVSLATIDAMQRNTPRRRRSRNRCAYVPDFDPELNMKGASDYRPNGFQRD